MNDSTAVRRGSTRSAATDKFVVVAKQADSSRRSSASSSIQSSHVKDSTARRSSRNSSTAAAEAGAGGGVAGATRSTGAGRRTSDKLTGTAASTTSRNDASSRTQQHAKSAFDSKPTSRSSVSYVSSRKVRSVYVTTRSRVDCASANELVNYTPCLSVNFISPPMTRRTNIAENDSSSFAGVKLSAVITLQTKS